MIQINYQDIFKQFDKRFYLKKKKTFTHVCLDKSLGNCRLLRRISVVAKAQGRTFICQSRPKVWSFSCLYVLIVTNWLTEFFQIVLDSTIVGCLFNFYQPALLYVKIWSRKRSCMCQASFKVMQKICPFLGYGDSWPWYLVTDRARFLKKSLAAQIWVRWAKIRPKTSFFAIFSNLVH